MNTLEKILKTKTLNKLEEVFKKINIEHLI